MKSVDKVNFTWLIEKHDPTDNSHTDKISSCAFCVALESYWNEYWGKKA